MLESVGPGEILATPMGKGDEETLVYFHGPYGAASQKAVMFLPIHSSFIITFLSYADMSYATETSSLNNVRID
jgi:hypothetical protein